MEYLAFVLMTDASRSGWSGVLLPHKGTLRSDTPLWGIERGGGSRLSSGVISTEWSLDVRTFQWISSLAVPFRLQCLISSMGRLGLPLLVPSDLRTQFLFRTSTCCLSLLGSCFSDQTISILCLAHKPSTTSQYQSVWSLFLNFLADRGLTSLDMTEYTTADVDCWPNDLLDASSRNVTPYEFFWDTRIHHQNNEYMQSVGRCLQMMLRVEEYRNVFYHLDGVVTIVQVLGGKHNFQIQYQLTFCLWVMTFNNTIAEKMSQYSVIPTLADILSESVKEKVTRITLAVFRNLIDKPEDPPICRENCIQMVQCKVLKQLEILSQRKFDDEDITADIEFLNEKLQNSIQDLSSFEEYMSEVKSGRMEWSPVHKSEKFWRENAGRLNEKNCELLKILINLLETSKDPLVLSVACHDIGEYTRHYSRGKRVLEQLGGKQWVMQHLTHEDPNVRYEALLAVQKLMVHNWEYLGKQLEKETTKGQN
ncbi:unnamed protein product, partial [Meganyctiphanes norvegica]